MEAFSSKRYTKILKTPLLEITRKFIQSLEHRASMLKNIKKKMKIGAKK